MADKKHYEVEIWEIGEEHGVRYNFLRGRMMTWAVSAEKAKSNIRYRFENKAFKGEIYGTDSRWHTYNYIAKEI